MKHIIKLFAPLVSIAIVIFALGITITSAQNPNRFSLDEKIQTVTASYVYTSASLNSTIVGTIGIQLEGKIIDGIPISVNGQKLWKVQFPDWSTGVQLTGWIAENNITKAVPASTITPVETTLHDFGGMYGLPSQYYNLVYPGNLNPATNDYSCPAGYSATAYGSSDRNFFICTRPHVAGQDSLYDFGGMYSINGYYTNPSYTNPITGNYTCPAQYTAVQIRGGSFGSNKGDRDAFYCYRPHFKGLSKDFYDFTYLGSSDVACPTDYKKAQVYGGRFNTYGTITDQDEKQFMCYRGPFTYSYSGATDQPPTISITSPVNGSIAEIGDKVKISTNSFDDVGISGVQFKVDGVNIGQEVVTSPYELEWDTIKMTTGNKTISATIRDTMGKTATARVSIQMNQKPVTVILSPEAVSYKAGDKVQISWNLREDIIPNALSVAVNISGNPSNLYRPIANNLPVQGTYALTIPNSLTSGQYLLNIELATRNNTPSSLSSGSVPITIVSSVSYDTAPSDTDRRLLVKRVDGNLSPIYTTQAKVTNNTTGVVSDNPAWFSTIPNQFGLVTAYATDLPNTDEYASTCSYLIGSSECFLSDSSLYYKLDANACSGGFCSAPVSIPTGKIGKVVFKYVPTVTNVLAPTLTLTASPASLTSIYQTASLAWSSSNTTSCVSSGNWSGVRSTSGTMAVGPGTYSLVCTGAGGSVTRSVTIPVSTTGTTPAPTVSISVSPSSITTDQSSMVSWSSTNASSCTVSNLRTNSTNSRQEVTFSSPTTVTYTATCTGQGGTASQSATLTVTSAQTVVIPQISVSAPLITSLSFSSCTQGTNNCRMEIKGANFTVDGNTVLVGNTSVGINGTSQGNLLRAYNGALVVDIPTSLAPGNYDIKVVNSNGTSNTKPFTMKPASSLPIVTSVSPSSGPTGSSVTLIGANFSSTNNTIQLNSSKGNLWTSAVSSNGTSMTFTFPSQYPFPNGTVFKIYVDNDEYGFSDENPTYLNNPATFTVTSSTSSTGKTGFMASIYEAMGGLFGKDSN